MSFFKMCVGKDYGKGSSVFKKKIMVVGASHYCGDGCADCGNVSAHPECAGFTEMVVRDYLDPTIVGDWKKTFTAFINSVYGHTASEEEKKKFFDSIVFYNYLQRSEGDDANEKHDEYFKAPQNLEAFKENLLAAKPDVVITWGARVWNQIPWDLGYGKAEEIRKDEVYRYKLCGSSFILVGVHHPSIGYDTSYWHDVIASVI